MLVKKSGRRAAPGLPARKVFLVDELKGADLYHSAASVEAGRSPDCRNMVRSVPGKVRKRMGYFLHRMYEGRINGRWDYAGHEIIHAGTNLYWDGVLLDSEMNDAKSTGFFFDNRLYLLDGKRYRYLENGGIGNVENIARVPRVMISKNPDGSGGRLLESVNLLSDRWTESFYGTESDVQYQLSFAELDSTPVVAKVLKADGKSYQELEEGSGITVDRVSGTVTFASAPGKSPLEGRDNVFITASKDRSAMRKRITECDVCAVYDGRVFVTGCGEYPNRDYWSAQDDPTFFGDVDYSVLGQSDARIVGYSLLDGKLAAHKNDAAGTVFVREGELVRESDETGNPVYSAVFRVKNVIAGRGAIAAKSFAALGGESLFLTRSGICALTGTDLTGERYEQGRSFFLDPAIAQEERAEEAVATIYRDFYVLAFPSGNVYLLDGLQKSYQKDQPYSTFQYEGYFWDNVPARCIWEKDGRLCFGDEQGNVWYFYTEEEDPQSYNDNGVAIAAHWQVSDLDGTVFYRAKNFRRCAVQIPSAVATSVAQW